MTTAASARAREARSSRSTTLPQTQRRSSTGPVCATHTCSASRWAAPSPNTWADTDDVFGDGVLAFAAAGQAPDLETATFILYEANVSQAFAAEETNFGAFRDAALSVRVPNAVALQQVVASAAHDVIDCLSAVTTPTLVVHGTKDAIIKVAAGERIAGAIPGAHLELWPGLAHHIPWEAPDRLADAVLRHIRAAS
jgi:pimeloyl-ACP methyl ester carboxylesterase